jgi:hypothetical protein
MQSELPSICMEDNMAGSNCVFRQSECKRISSGRICGENRQISVHSRRDAAFMIANTETLGRSDGQRAFQAEAAAYGIPAGGR